MTLKLRRGALLLSAVPFMILGLFLPVREAIPVSAPAERRAVLIIDPGHGGEDGGAVGVGDVKESGINLAVSERLRTLAVLCGCETVMTRVSEEIEYPPEADTTAKRKRWDQHRRAELISGYPNGVLISIHQNFFPDSRPWGAQALYAETAGSRELAELMHAELNAALSPKNRRVAVPAGEDIYLMRSVPCTAVLIECGFISNAEECALLTDDTYQTKLAVVLLGSYLRRGSGDGV